MSDYKARPIKRHRATKVEMEERLHRIRDLVAEHQPCSVRHVFYRAVVDGVPLIGKDDRGYAKVQRAVLQLRREGRIPYSWITDNSRAAFTVDVWDGVDGFLNDIAGVYRRDLWQRSGFRVEVWCESDSIAGTLSEITHRWRVPLFPIRGQSSETFVYNAVQQWLTDPDREVVVLYIGDHDPAGLEIEQALKNKMVEFSRSGTTLAGITVRMQYEPWFQRLGVTWQQVVDLDLPGTPPKKSYDFPLAVEAEALPPRMLREIVDAEIGSYVDKHELNTLLAVEEEERKGLYALAGGQAS